MFVSSYDGIKIDYSEIIAKTLAASLFTWSRDYMFVVNIVVANSLLLGVDRASDAFLECVYCVDCWHCTEGANCALF